MSALERLRLAAAGIAIGIFSTILYVRNYRGLSEASLDEIGYAAIVLLGLSILLGFRRSRSKERGVESR